MSGAGALRPVGRFVVAADHPCLAGHFPGRPIVPGVVLLDCVLGLLASPAGSLPRVKFTAAVRPGETIEVLASPADGGRIDFAATREGQPVLRGTAGVG